MLSRSAIAPALALACLAGTASAEIHQMVCFLSGRQEVPANASPAFGCGVFRVDTDANTVSYRITRSPVTTAEVAAHIHGFSGPGVNSGVVHALPSGELKIGVWNYPEAMENDILNGRCYVNIHSSSLPGGEIRGQIVDAVAELDGGQEVPANASAARGFGLINLDTVTNTARIYVGLDGVVGEVGAHIHGIARQGINAPVIFALPLGPVKVATWNYPEAIEQELLSGLCYFNVHTAAFPGGEIRGQIITSVNVVDRLQEVPNSITSSVGCVLCGLDRQNNGLTYDLRISLLGSVQTAAHIHGFSPAIGIGNRVLGGWNYPAAAEASIENQLTYVNVHSNVFPGGEIRGQLFFPPLPAPCFWQATGSCAADYDGDGDFDSDDVVFYFMAFDTSEACADADGDGDVDSDDVIEFFNKWEAGSC